MGWCNSWLQLGIVGSAKKNRICMTVGPLLAVSLEPLAHRGNVCQLKSFIQVLLLVDVHVNWLNCLHFLIIEVGPTRYSDRLHDFSIAIPRCYKDVYVNSLFPRTARLWNFLPMECFPLTYDLNDFNNKHLLTVGFSKHGFFFW